MSVLITPLSKRDLPAADEIHRRSFAAFLGLENPADFEGDAQVVRSRFNAGHTWMAGAFRSGRLLGSVCLSHQGSISLLGPITVTPECWNQGIGHHLMAAAITKLNQWDSRLSGLFTFPQSSKHIRLYQKFAFWPDRLIAVMRKPIQGERETPAPRFIKAGEISPDERDRFLAQCRGITAAIFTGWDLSGEITAVLSAGHGECLGIMKNDRLQAFAVCHFGAGSEGGSDQCYIKAAAVRPGADSSHCFSQLIQACESLSASRQLPVLTLGVHTNRRAAYHYLLESGFSLFLQGISMVRHAAGEQSDEPHYVLGDWR